MIEYGEVGKMWTESALLFNDIVQIRADMIKYTTETQSTMAHFKVLLQKVPGGTKGTTKNISQYSQPSHQKLILGPFEYNSTCHLID